MRHPRCPKPLRSVLPAPCAAANPSYLVVYADDFRFQVFIAQSGPNGVPRLNINALTYIDAIVGGVLA